MSELTAEEIREALDYDGETGEFRWRKSCGAKKAGSRAGYLEPGRYWSIQFRGQMLYLHRVAWLHAYGVWPSGEIDHINQDKSDNRLSNLRDGTKSQNKANVGVTKQNTSGIKGVRRRNGRFEAQIKVNGKYKHLGVFHSAEMARLAYESAAGKYFGAFARVG